ncbi:hypothetical protein GPECTOR_40g599 [Gonium pectorale]|uniref:Uncharacterized protein n=1 Tax=Gonium pectorale TaxID=33097 RepID=A0A150GBC1_GONPE|nr:hypothetical protein GPECTOR_40g599 [Gonium pectorale]|eukprot:KXZ46865.1 hypothetical protein GPECTOR_40g599 [Gonium pectorale]
MDLFETLGLGPRQPEENELYIAIYADPNPDPDSDPGAGSAPCSDAAAAADGAAGGGSGVGTRQTEVAAGSWQVWDNDGQFLLIEAAYALPRWLKPDVATNRVWLRCGRLHIVPLPSAAAPDLPPSPSAAQALAVMREGRYSTASPRVQRPIDERLEGYPGRARREQQHVARCLLPGPLAAALRAEPQLVAELVEAFYNRDAEDMRAASRMRLLPPSLERSPVLVRMTRCHYAQLAQQRFAAPRGLPVPPPDSPLAKAADLGLKLTVAAEALCARYPDAGAAAAPEGGPDVPPAAAAPTAASLAADPAWRRFLGSLESNGYFQGNIPGSRRYKELLAAAVEAFTAGRSTGADGGAGAAGAAPERQDPRRRLAALVRQTAAAGAGPEDGSGSWIH